MGDIEHPLAFGLPLSACLSCAAAVANGPASISKKPVPDCEVLLHAP